MGEEHQRAAAAKVSASLAKKNTAQLFCARGRNQMIPSGFRRKIRNKNRHKSLRKTYKKARWDPYDRFTREEPLTEFLSGQKYRCHSLIDRESFAKFAIQKVLDGHPDDNFEITGEIMKNESVVDQSDELEDIVNVIRADGQQDVDAEIPQDHGTRSSKTEDNEFTQTISAAAQSIISASPNSLGPPINPCAMYLKMTKCGQYGRSNSTVWRSPFIPKLDNENGRRGLLDHQVTAIVWLLSRLFGDLPTLEYKDPKDPWGNPYSDTETPSDVENRKRLKGPKYFGGILADSMGLGKTLITTALVNLLMSQELNVMRAEDGTTIHRPVLLVTPNPTVANQWVQEFVHVTDPSTLYLIIVSGPGLEEIGHRDRVVYFDRDNFLYWPSRFNFVWNEDDPLASKVVLIMTLDSWAVRTCDYRYSGKQGWHSTFTDKSRGFSLVIVDEAHKVKNHKTKNWRSIYLLERQFTLLITATPCLNTLTDIFGLARLLWSVPEQYLKQNPTVWSEMEEVFGELEKLELLDKYPSSHDFQLVAGRPALLARMLFKHREARTHDIDLTRQYLRHFEALAMLKRSPSSYIYADWEKTSHRSLEGLFPKVENYTVDVSPGEAYEQEYQRVHIDLVMRYLKGLKDWGTVVDEVGQRLKKEEDEAKLPIVNSIRLLQIASSSLDVYNFNTIVSANGYSTLSVEVAKMREKQVDLLKLAEFLVIPTEPKPETHIGWMALVTRNSPILRYILRYITEKILIREANGKIRKLLIVEHNPMVAFYYELVLQFLGFECRCMHAQLSLNERQELVDSFNSSDNESCQILIQLYTVGFAGTNLHKSCSQVLVSSQAHSLQVQWQAIYRVIRVGQTSDVTVHRVKLKNSYHSFRESRQIEKILPELGARAHGNTKRVLVRLLNLFQYEIHEAWHSSEGQKLRQEKNLLDDDNSDEEAEPSAHKGIKKEEDVESPAFERVKLSTNPMIKVEDKKIKKEEVDSPESLFSSFEPLPTSSSNKRGQEPLMPRPGNGSGGWYNKDGLSDDAAFLALRTRDEYYEEFIDLPRKAKSVFSHSKNNLRRLLSYGNDDRTLSTRPWNEADLENPAVLERGLELMLRVRLGAKEIAMLPFPMIDLSRASASRRAQLQLLLAETRYTDQDLNSADASSASKESKEVLRGTDLKKPLAQIDEDLEKLALFTDDIR
ncbi:P-loop containing nucleoside triphosphate hydrolase protein [Xylaria sp. FL1777]|nr:P-loop containing nucleoside triphosphate hydrolase protein [Xylaria sp. FL1777]